MNWDDLRLLLAVARRGSFLQAGDALGMAASTLSRRITQLEHAVGEPLVERGVEGSRLTARGASLADTARQLESELLRSHHATGISGTVRVSAGEGFVRPIQHAIARFTEAHPDCSVDFTVVSDLLKIGRGAVDVAIRTVHLGEPSLIYHRLPPVTFGIYTSASYASQLGPQPRAEQAAMIDLLPPLDQLAHLRAARAAGFSRVRFRVSSFAAQDMAVAQGLGAAVLPHALASHLVAPFGAIPLPPLEVFLVTRPPALRQPHIRAFVDILQAEMHGHTAAPQIN